MKKTKKLFKHVYVLLTTAVAFAATVAPAIIRAADVTTIQNGVFLPVSDPLGTPAALHVRVTAYSSSPDETDSTPFVTASGMKVRDGIVATNILPFGTRIKIPSLFGDKIFTVEDRMARRMKNAVDIWMSTKTAALRFGANEADIVIIADKTLSLKK